MKKQQTELNTHKKNIPIEISGQKTQFKTSYIRKTLKSFQLLNFWAAINTIFLN